MTPQLQESVAILLLLVATPWTSDTGHQSPLRCVRVMSAYPPIAASGNGTRRIRANCSDRDDLDY